MAERLLDLADRFSEVLTRVQVLVGRLLELHVLKLVALYTVWVALKEVREAQGRLLFLQWGPLEAGTLGWQIAGPLGRCRSIRPPAPAPRPPAFQVSVMNLLLVVLWAFALPYPRFRPMASCLSTVWTCIIIVCKMLYQLKVVSPHEYSSNCTEVCGRLGRVGEPTRPPLCSPLLAPARGLLVPRRPVPIPTEVGQS